MSLLSESSQCQPLIEACTLELYEKNIFRVTGLPVDATSKEVARQVQKLQMMEEVSGGAMRQQAAFSLVSPPSTEQIREALGRMKEPEHRLIDEFFWFWPEEFGKSKNDPAIEAMLAGDSEKAYSLWRECENEGSVIAAHNLAILFHMSSVDWTHHHLAGDIDPDHDEKIKNYWYDAFARWEHLADSDELWDIVKERVRSLEDEALTTGFVRRMRRVLPQAFDRINAEAALKFAEQQRMDWAEFHVDFMRQTHQGDDDVDGTAELVLGPTKQRVEQCLRTARDRTNRNPENGPKEASGLMEHCQPLMAVFDLFHGEDSHQRNDLFDGVAEAVTELLITYQKATGDNRTSADLLQQALTFATSSQIRERLINNIAIAENNLAEQQLEPFFQKLDQVMEIGSPASKLECLRSEILPLLPSLASNLGQSSPVYIQLMDSVAIIFRELSIDAYNSHQNFSIAEEAIQLAFQFVVDPNHKRRIEADIKTLKENKEQFKCAVCKTNPPVPECTLNLPIAGISQEIRSKLDSQSIKQGFVKIPRCRQCKKKQDANAVSNTGNGCLILLFLPLGFLILSLYGMGKILAIIT